MTDTEEDDQGARDALSRAQQRSTQAWRSMEALRDVLDAKVTELRAVPAAASDPREAIAAAKEVAKSHRVALEEEGKAYEIRRIGSGGDGIDFDAARSAIRGRLDRIARAGGPRGVDCGP
ncbi:hypothetical protein ACK8OR_04745 [Jannaschia sp. KMU-145]|uniref:hypothetical protein n=1 Tax=Jannaschia halovivens TaxID=3388667 RepID=UPI00396AFCEB